MKTKLKRTLGILIALVMIAGILPTVTFAATPTSITLTDENGKDTQIVISDGTATPSTGTNWSYDVGDNKLTLTNWTGQKIFANGDFNLHLIGANTITMAATDTCGINVKEGSG